MKITHENKEIELKEKNTIRSIFEKEIKESKYAVISAIVNNEYKSLDDYIEQDSTVELVDISTKEGTRTYRTTLLYVMSMAFSRLYPEARLTINYQLDNSMFCEVDNMSVTAEMINAVKEEMKNIIESDLKIENRVFTREEAEKFYEVNHVSKGRIQLDLESNNEISLYFCEEYFNYFCCLLGSRTKVVNKFDLIKYKHGFLLRYPSTTNPNIIPELVETKKLQWAFREYDDIIKTLGVNTVYRLNKAIDEGKMSEIILTAEALHEKKLAKIADEIVKRNGVRMILIAGPSSSGKTTFAQRLGIQLKLNGIKPVTISVDNYFVERENNPKDESGNYDFETIEAIDMDLFNDHLTRLLNGEEIEMPEFDFFEGKKKYNGKKVKLAEDEILVIEGIHCLNDRLTSRIPKEQKYKIYISALTVLNMDYHNRISTTDTRLIRRMVRDYNFRGYSAIHTIKTWYSVNRGEVKNIFPFQEEADATFNTSLVYELGALRNSALRLLEDIENTTPEYAEAQRLINIIKYFKPIPEELIPINSLLKEFLGGGVF